MNTINFCKFSKNFNMFFGLKNAGKRPPNRFGLEATNRLLWRLELPALFFTTDFTDYAVLIRVFCLSVGGDDLLLDVGRDKVIVAERHGVAAASAGYAFQLACVLRDFCQRHLCFNS